MKKALLLIFLLALAFTGLAQDNSTVFDYAATTRYLSSSAPRPAVPASDNNVYSWYATKKMSWDASSFKAYIFNGMVFRLKYPKNYDPANTIKKYPIVLYYAGAGEGGSVYDNEQQLAYAKTHMEAVDNSTFDGFLLFPESTDGFWIDSYYDKIAPLIEIICANTNADINRVIVEGYSSGGIGVVESIRKYPKLFAGALPMSVINGWRDYSRFAEIPEWVFQGAIDTNPDPYNTDRAVNSLLALGANIKYTKYPNVGHGTWGLAYADPDFYPFMLRAHKANPIAYFGRTEFCDGETPNIKLGLTAGFNGYEWRKNGTVINNANGNTLQINDFGSYDARIKRGSEWSVWSPAPVVIKLKTATVSPKITVVGPASNIIPAPGSSNVTLQVASAFSEYEWRKQGGTDILSTTNRLVVNEAGNYTVKVKEQYGCSSAFSAPFTVIDANGPNKPDAASNITVSSLSKTELQLNWANNTNPVNNETAFEIYRSTKKGTEYKYAGKTGADTLKFKDTQLLSNTKYYYVVRAVNATGASVLSDEASGITNPDNSSPTPPGNLRITATTRTYVDLAWDAAIDDVGIKAYNIYVNDLLSYSAPSDATSFRVNNLENGKNYNFRIIAKDVSGNFSLTSNQVSAIAAFNGLSYKYYEPAATWSALPDFNQLTPVKAGIADSVTLTDIIKNSNSTGVLFEGYINIPTTGSYTFGTTSDDGSKLYIGSYNPTATALVNNDGNHSSQSREGTVTLTKGVYPIAISFYNAGGGYDLSVYWKTPGVSTSQIIPRSAFTDNPTPLTKPVAPTQINALTKGYDQIELSWKDNSSDETGFEVYRSENYNGPYLLVGKIEANLTSYLDKNLTASKSYFYEVKSISSKGESALSGAAKELSLSFDGNYDDNSGFGRNASASGGATFSTSIKKEGTQALSLDGVNGVIAIGGTSTGYLHDAFTAKTISFWFNPQLLTNTRVLLDIGSSTAGIAMRTNATNLELGIASGNNRRTYSTSLNLNTWYHIVAVYKDKTVMLYKNGVLVASDTNLPFSSIPATTDNSRIGTTLGTNAFNATNTFYSKGYIDALNIYDAPLTTDEISQLYALNSFNNNSFTTTSPAVPAVPANFITSNISSDKIQLNWTLSDNNDVQYALYRSVNDNGSYVKIHQDTSSTGSYTDTSLYTLTQYFYKLKAINISGESAFTNEVSATTTAVPPVVSTKNVTYKYYETASTWWNIPDFSQLTPVSTGKIDAVDLASVTLRANNYGVVFEGYINIPVSGNYTFETNSDDGSKLYIGSHDLNRTPLVNNDGTHGVQFREGTIALTKGVYPIAVSYVQSYNGATLEVYWKNTANGVTARQLIPSEFFVPAPVVTPPTTTTKNITYKYYETASTWWNMPDFSQLTPKTTGTTDNVDLSISHRADNYGVVYEGYINIPVSGSYTFETNSDDGSKLYIGSFDLNRTPLVNNDGTHSAQFKEGTITLAKGVYPIAVSYVQSYNGNTLEVYWKNTASGVTSRQLIPKEFFVAAPTTNPPPSTVKNVTYKYYETASTWWNMPDFTVLTPKTTGKTEGIDLSVTHRADNYGFVFEGYINIPVSGSYTFETNSDDGSKLYIGSFDQSKVPLVNNDGTHGAQFKEGTITLAKGVYPIVVSYVQSYNGNTLEVYWKNTANGVTSRQLIPSEFFVENPTTPNGVPANLTALAKSKTSIQLNWQDNSANETGFEIARSATETGTYTTVGTVAANAVSYTNNSLTANTKYWYKIRATGSTGNSDYTAAVAGSTFTYSVQVNFTREEPALSPWNNTNKSPEDGDRFPNLVSTDNVNTGIIMTIPDNFSGANSLGVVTGNNSGKYPDAVSKWAYYSEKNETAKIRFSGLNTAYSYDFEFFNSWNNPFAVAITNFTINGVTVSLNPAYNTTNTAVINNINPDQYGEITIDVFMPDGSSYAWLNALTLNAHPLIGTRPPLVAFAKNAIGYGKTGLSSSETNAATEIKAYPNPFVSRIFVNLDATYQQAKSLRTDLVDQSGRVISTEKSQAGQKFIEMDVQKFNLLPGMYFIRLSGEGVQTKTFKMMKQ